LPENELDSRSAFSTGRLLLVQTAGKHTKSYETKSLKDVGTCSCIRVRLSAERVYWIM
jgi:hypothetical protein